MTQCKKRYRLFADFKLQTLLCVRIAAYWICCQVTVLTTVFVMYSFESSGAESSASPWRFIIPAMVMSSIVLPIALLDLLYFSNKFAGPLMRVRRHLKKINQGHEVAPIKFRTGDYYKDLGDEINQLTMRENEIGVDLDSQYEQLEKKKEMSAHVV